MARVLKSFLIGLGYDTKGLEEGEKKFKGSIGGVKSTAVTTSAALIGAFALAATSVAATASEVDQLALRTQNLRTSTQTVYNFGNAIRLMGGDAADAVSALSRFEEIQNNLRLRGNAGPIADLAMAGIDVSSLYQTQTGEEFARALAGMLPGLDEGQRSIVQESLGLSDAAFRSLAGGVEALDASLQKAQGLTGNVDQLVEDSRKLRESTTTLGLAVDGARNELANKFLPAMVGATGAAADFAVKLGDFVAGRSEQGRAFEQAGALGVIAVEAEKAGVTDGAAALRMTGGILENADEVSLLESAIPGYKQAAQLYEFLFGDASSGQSQVYSGAIDRSRSAGDSMAPSQSADQARQANADALAGALSRAPLKVDNSINLSVQLDGSALDARIIDVSEQQSYQALEDMRTTTDR